MFVGCSGCCRADSGASFTNGITMGEVLTKTLADFWGVLTLMAPYLLLGFFVAGLLSVLISPRRVERHLGGRGFLSVLKAAAFGVPLPLCSCGVIPVAASLRRHGAGRGATTAFLISTPQTGVDSIFVTYGLLGGLFALLRPVLALISGVIGGLAVALLDPEGRQGEVLPGGGNSNNAALGANGSNKLLRLFRYGFITLPADIGRSLLVGLLAAGLITALLPPELLAGVFENRLAAMLLMLAAGIPMYVCATASVPVVAALIATQGLSPGAGLVFLMTGPATNLATIGTIWKVMGRRTAIIYLASVALTALAAGLVMDATYAGLEVAAPAHLHHHAGPGSDPFGTIASIVLLAILAPSLITPVLHWWRRRSQAAAKPAEAQPDRLTLAVEGMTCSHCQSAVTRALRECPGVESAHVDLQAKQALVEGRQLDAAALCAAVNDLGYAAHRVDG